jgi:two-component system response regulator MprA
MKEKSVVLIVDDDELVRDGLADTFACAGYEVRTARDGRNALDQIHGGLRPDVVVSDGEMPRLSGYGLCAELSADEETAAIPTILISGRPDFARAKELDVPVVQKPFDSDALVARARDAIATRE